MVKLARYKYKFLVLIALVKRILFDQKFVRLVDQNSH